MTRDETIALFEESEAKRMEALAAGKSADEAHDAAMAHWNAWAESILSKKKLLKDQGVWKVSRRYGWKPEKGENAETKAGLETAVADFSFLIFLCNAEGPKENSDT